jgi:hypothetical protein
VVARLAEGRQPDAEIVESVGYLMRTTAVYGSGKFGAADREAIADRPELAAPFQAEMLSVYLTRAYTLDLAEHLARLHAPATAATMDPALRRRFGVGNSTGLGMAPFLLTHPALINNWITARETALARVRAVQRPTEAEVAGFRALLARARVNAATWRSEHPAQIGKLAQLTADLDRLSERISETGLTGDAPWDRLYHWAEENLSPEGQEQLVSLLLEPYGALVDDLAASMSADEAEVFRIDGAMPLGKLKAIIEDIYAFALRLDWSRPETAAKAWYVSAEKLEPRLGERFEEPIEPYEQPLSPCRDAARMHADIVTWTGEDSVAAFLLRHPQHRHIARRVQIAARLPYAEIRDNTIAADILPIDLLRCKLSFFGANHFDPRSDRWVRINMYKGAPFPHELAERGADDWAYPPLPEAAP